MTSETRIKKKLGTVQYAHVIDMCGSRACSLMRKKNYLHYNAQLYELQFLRPTQYYFLINSEVPIYKNLQHDYPDFTFCER